MIDAFSIAYPRYVTMVIGDKNIKELHFYEGLSFQCNSLNVLILLS